MRISDWSSDVCSSDLICPWSPSGRYLALTKLPYQRRKPLWGDTADVCVVDLEKRAIRTVYCTRAWAFQVGANVQWNDDTDRHLNTNDIIGGQPVCVRIDLDSGETVAFSGPKYDVAPDGKSVVSPYLPNMNVHQYGYAVPDPPSGKPKPFGPEDRLREGLWRTDLEQKKTTLRSEEHTSELQSLMRISYAVFCLNKKS